MSDQMRPFPGGLPARTLAALDDLRLIESDRHRDLEAWRWARLKAAALVAALAAETRTPPG